MEASAFRFAIVGATGLVGREMLAILAERGVPAAQICALASRQSEGAELDYGRKKLSVRALEDYDFAQADIALFAVSSALAQTHVPRAAAAGCVAIDNSSHFRMAADVPLIVPEVNAAALPDISRQRIIANPNCSTAQLVLALKPLHEAAQLTRVVVATYQSVSGAGREAMDGLFEQTRRIYAAQHADEKPSADAPFAKQMAFNVIPQIQEFMDDGSTKEEWKMAAETSKLLGADIPLSASCVRVPVFIGHGEAVHASFAKPLRAAQARALLRRAPGVAVKDERRPGGYVSPVEAAGKDQVFVSRLREDKSVRHGLAFWVVADNLRKGAALNAVQIAELVMAQTADKPAMKKSAVSAPAVSL